MRVYGLGMNDPLPPKIRLEPKKQLPARHTVLRAFCCLREPGLPMPFTTASTCLNLEVTPLL